MRAEPQILPLRLDGVSYVAGATPLLSDVGFEVRPRERTVLLGPNGAGKSLVLQLCHGLLAPSAGRISWLGPGAAGPGKRHAMVFQRPVLLRRSAAANVRHALALAGVGRAERAEAAAAALARFGLDRLAARPARVLSGGERQRLAMARAWALRPQVLFLDEPCTGLDPAATKAIEDMITEFHRDGVTVVMTTHDLAQARRVAERVLFLHNGRLLDDAPAADFFRCPRSEAAQAFLDGALLW